MRWHRWVGWSSAALALGLIGFGGVLGLGLGWLFLPRPLVPLSHAEMRAGLINGYLGQVASPYVFLAGDSFIELYQPETLPCGREVVNGGVGGYRVAEYAAMAKGLLFRTPPSVVFLSIGLNDLRRKDEPLSPGRLNSLRENAEALIRTLGQGGTKVLVAEIPPIGDTVEAAFQTDAFRVYSDQYRSLCSRLGCEVVDPYLPYRTAEYWRSKPGASPDGIHLGDLRGAFGRLRSRMCS